MGPLGLDPPRYGRGTLRGGVPVLGRLTDVLWKNRIVLGYSVAALTVRLLYATFGFTDTFDWFEYRLPIAEQLSEGKLLYRDVPYDHMPLYPYYTGFAYHLFGDSYVALMFPAILGDALIAPLLYVLTRNHMIASLYLVSAVSIQQCGNARWDGLTTLFLLLAISYDDDVRFSAFTAVGICLKQFPAIALVRVLLGREEMTKLLYTALISLATVSVFLVACPREFIDGIIGHPVYSGSEGYTNLDGSMAAFLPYWAWVTVFVPMLALTLYTFRRCNLRNTVGILVFLATFMLYKTHGHTEVAFIPFALLLMQRSRYWVFAYLFCQYFIQLRTDHDDLANYLFPLTFIIWGALVWENLRIRNEAGGGQGDVIHPRGSSPPPIPD
jgi:hypothetical protein